MGCKNKEDYLFYKSRGICTHCKKEKAENGILCLACKMRNREYRGKRDKEKQREYDRKRIENARANGLCLTCRTRPQQHGLVCNRCYATRLRINARKRTIPRSEWVSYGLCYICGKNELLKGKKVCASCYEVRCKSISKIMYMSKEDKNENF